MPDLDSQHEAFIRLLTKNERLIQASIRAVIRRPEDVDEVMQMTSIAAWNKFHTLEDEEGFGRWACVIARYEILKFRRKMARDRHELNPELIARIVDEGAEELPARNRRLEHLESCLQRLPESRRALVMRAYQPGCSIQDIAAEIGKSRDGLYQLLKRIRVALANCVEGEVTQGGSTS
ncbi:MAG: sigma-70 family RNA polymerase sigma factor [Verrucomicrobiota bacterium]